MKDFDKLCLKKIFTYLNDAFSVPLMNGESQEVNKCKKRGRLVTLL